MTDLRGRVALVTGASRGVGRGVVLGLHEAGCTVYASGRTVAGADLPPGVVRLPCDHTDDTQVERIFARVDAEQERLDLLVNGAWGGYERMMEDGRFTWPAPFWEQPHWRWDAMMTTGVRSAFVASRLAAQRMVRARRGLLVSLSYWAARKYVGNAVYGMAKAATDKLMADAAHELRPHGVTAVALYPGLVRTEAVLAAASLGALDLTHSESPQFVGRAVAALAGDTAVIRWTGHVVIAAELAKEYGFADVDGVQPRPLMLEDA